MGVVSLEERFAPSSIQEFAMKGPGVARLLLLIPLAFALSCSVEKPVAPKWETSIAVPLIDKTFTVRELVEDEEDLFFDQDSVLNFSVEKSLDTYYVGERLKISALEKIVSADMGNFRVDSPDTVSVHVTFGEIYPPSQSIPPGQSVVVPAFEFQTDVKAAAPFSAFQYVKLSGGWLELTVVNDLPVPLGSPPQAPLSAKIWGGSPSGEPLLVVEFPEAIPPGSRRNLEVDVSGLLIPGRLYIQITGGSEGSRGQAVPIDPQHGFAVSVYLRDLAVEEAVARIPEQEIRTHASFPIKDTLAVQEAVIKRGAVAVDFENALPLGVRLSYEMPNFQRDGKPLRGEFQLSPRTKRREWIDLAGVRITAQPGSRPGEQELDFDWLFSTLSTGSAMVSLRASDSLHARLKLEEIVLSEITGEVGGIRVGIDPIVRRIDVPDQVDSLEFERVTLELALEHTLEFPARAHIVIEGSRDDGRTAEIALDPTLNPAPPDGPRTDRFIIDQDYPGFKQWISMLPTSVLVRGSVEVGAPGWVGTVSEQDWLRGSVTISAPVAVRIPEQTTRGKVDSLKSKAEDREEVLDFVKGVRLVAEVENRLLFGGSVVLKFAHDSSLVYEQPEVTVGPIGIDPARKTNGQIQPARRTIEIALGEAQLNFFRSDPIYSGVEVYFPGTGDQPAELRASDYLRVRAYLETRVLVHERKDGD
jgi:hypothetical protein